MVSPLRPFFLLRPDSIQNGGFFALSITIMLFAGWTTATHLAVLAGIPWQHLKYGFLILLPVLVIFSWRLSVVVASLFHEETMRAQPRVQSTTARRYMLLLLAWIIMMVVMKEYVVRYALASSFLVIVWFTKTLSNRRDPEYNEEGPQSANGRHYVKYLIILIMAAIGVTLFAHRPDLDDSSYLQIAVSTLKNQTLPIFSYDTSLGNLVNRFRFAPYILSSYELLISLVTDLTGKDLLFVYYIVFPTMSAALAIITAFLLSRWFLPSRSAIIAVAIYFLICLAWGESHLAFGNRLFVRLFQGKGLLIAIATPSIILAGLLAMRRPCWQTRLLFWACIIAGIGFSSTGLIVGIVAGSIAIISGTIDMNREGFHKALFTAVALIYPISAGLLLKYFNTANVAFSEIGTLAGINASLGSDIREVIALIIMAVGAASLRMRRHHKALFLLTLFTVVITLSPLLSQAISAVSVRNASWRLAWAGPVPLLMAILLAGLLRESMGQRRILSGILAISAILTFACADRWVLSKDNNVSFSTPSPTISPDYFTTAAIMTRIKMLTDQPVVLATSNIAAWVPVTNPGTRIIMPGHTYDIELENILESDEYKERMHLFSMVNGSSNISSEPVARIAQLFRRYGINVVIARKSVERDLEWVKALASLGIVSKFQFDVNEYVSFVY